MVQQYYIHKRVTGSRIPPLVNHSQNYLNRQIHIAQRVPPVATFCVFIRQMDRYCYLPFLSADISAVTVTDFILLYICHYPYAAPFRRLRVARITSSLAVP